MSISHQKRRTGVYSPRKFVNRLRKENGVCARVCVCVCVGGWVGEEVGARVLKTRSNLDILWLHTYVSVSLTTLTRTFPAELFRGHTQQDAHKFLSYLLNAVAEGRNEGSGLDE